LHALVRLRGRGDADTQGRRVERARCLRNAWLRAAIRACRCPCPHFQRAPRCLTTLHAAPTIRRTAVSIR